jgi:hypothetical protein
VPPDTLFENGVIPKADFRVDVEGHESDVFCSEQFARRGWERSREQFQHQHHLS